LIIYFIQRESYADTVHPEHSVHQVGKGRRPIERI
jgi:hypothetical protein